MLIPFFPWLIEASLTTFLSQDLESNSIDYSWEFHANLDFMNLPFFMIIIRIVKTH